MRRPTGIPGPATGVLLEAACPLCVEGPRGVFVRKGGQFRALPGDAAVLTGRRQATIVQTATTKVAKKAKPKGKTTKKD